MDYTLEEFIKINHGFLYQFAKVYVSNVGIYGIEFDDLYQVGCLGLIEYYSKYDATKGSVSTFSYWVIRKSMLDYINNNCTVTHIERNLLIFLRQYEIENALFYQMNGRLMTFEEQEQLVEKMNAKNYLRLNNLAKVLNTINLYHYRNSTYSLNDINDCYDANGKVFVSDVIEDCIRSDVNVEESVITNIMIENFINSLTYLTEKEKDIFLEVLGLYDGIPKSCIFLAEKHSVSQKWASGIYNKALRKVKSKVKNNLI